MNEATPIRPETPDEKLSFTIMVDPPDCGWELTTPGLLYTLQSWSKIIKSMNPEDPNYLISVQEIYEVAWPSLRMISDALLAQMDAGQEHEKQVRQQIAEGQKD